MKIIDSHAHLFPRACGITNSAPVASASYGKFRNGNTEYQFLPPSFTGSNSTAETMLGYMDWQGVDKALVMPNPLYGYHNDYVMEAVRKYPERLKGIALVNVLKGRAAAEELAVIYETTELFGMKIEPAQTFQCAAETQLCDKALLPVWDCCNQYHSPVFVHLSTRQNVADIFQLIEAFPNITFIICHMGADACHVGGHANELFDRLLMLCKENERVYLDTSSVSVYYAEEYPFPGATAAIEKAYKTLGAEKLLFGTDYPGMLAYATYRELIDMVLRHCNIPESGLESIMAGNAERLFFAK